MVKMKKILNLNDFKRIINKSERHYEDQNLKELKFYNELLPGM